MKHLHIILCQDSHFSSPTCILTCVFSAGFRFSWCSHHSAFLFLFPWDLNRFIPSTGECLILKAIKKLEKLNKAIEKRSHASFQTLCPWAPLLCLYLLCCSHITSWVIWLQSYQMSEMIDIFRACKQTSDLMTAYFFFTSSAGRRAENIFSLLQRIFSFPVLSSSLEKCRWHRELSSNIQNDTNTCWVSMCTVHSSVCWIWLG